MRRREFITLLGGAAAWPLATHAQQGDRVARIAAWIGGAANDQEAQARAATFRDSLRELGWVEGRNLRIEYRWAINSPEQNRVDAAALVALNPEVIMSTGAPAFGGSARPDPHHSHRVRLRHRSGQGRLRC